MFTVICRNLRYAMSGTVISARKFQNPHFPASSSARFSSEASESDRSSFTVSYLINAHEFSPEQALSASRYVNIETPEKPQLVVAFFKSHGFTDSQITSLVKRAPPILQSSPEKTLLPKLEFLKSKGLSSQDVAKILSMSPAILSRSLKNQIIPAFEYFKDILKSEEKTILAVKRFGLLLVLDHRIYFADKIDTLREVGVPESNIVAFLVTYPRNWVTNAGKFKETVNEVKKMGFDPKTMMFVIAICTLGGMSKLTRKNKVEAYKKWGWSEDNVYMAFRRDPGCMRISVNNIDKTMDFFVNKMGWDSSIIAAKPTIIYLSLERRIIPRCLVYQFLLSKGLMKKKRSIGTLLTTSENHFLDSFMKPYVDEAPELLKLYQAKLAPSSQNN